MFVTLKVRVTGSPTSASAGSIVRPVTSNAAGLGPKDISPWLWRMRNVPAAAATMIMSIIRIAFNLFLAE